ncbi:MAG: phage tail sheath family protein [Lachnospiraceae bacterium]|nr:phage tail sheath family protein [Lachnospiraceae bacterium]
MLGGGVFTKQNKVLPGAYINFVSAAARGDKTVKGVVCVPMESGWGPERKVMKVDKDSFEDNCLRLLGYPVSAPEMQAFREMFLNANEVYVFRINSEGVKASNDLAEARYAGTRGNAVRLVVQKNVEDDTKFDVRTLVGTDLVDAQTATAMSELADNDFVSFKREAALTETAGMPLTGGTDGAVSGEAYQEFLNAIEQKPFNVLVCPTKDESTVNLFAAFTKRMREELGVRFQTIAYRASRVDYEGVISVENSASENEAGLVYWVAGASAACAVNKSNTNKVYDGEYTVNVAYTQMQLSDGIKEGKFLLHQVGDEVRVLRDINSLVSFTEDKNSDFSDNQTIRVLDFIGNGIASLFAERFMGQVPNDASGRISLWNEIVTFYKSLAAQRAIEAVEPKAITVEGGGTKRSVLVNAPVQPTNCMDQLYMTVVVE